MSDFLAENNVCGQNLLRIVSFGNAVIAELLRLSDYIPPVFRLDPSAVGFSKYREIIFDFDFFSQNRTVYENKMSQRPELLDIDEEFKENFMDIVTRFYVAFESIYRYVSDLNRFIEELEEGIYIQQTLETIFLPLEGKQLMCEALYLYGVMLLIMDAKITGPVRERMLVSYYRYSSADAATDSNIVDVCKLLRSTGYSVEPNSCKRPQNYPESLLSRVPVKQEYVSMVLGRLKADDIYNSSSYYPYPEHHSTALAPQAAMLFVCLFFDEKSLQSEPAKMREIVDKFFSDNWIVNIYMGSTANLVEWWQPYDAAWRALSNTLETKSVSVVVKRHAEKLQDVRPRLENVLKEGVLRDDYVLDNITPLMNLLRDCNVCMRWLMLHTARLTPGADTSKKCVQLREQVLSESKLQSTSILALLLSTAQLELRLRQILERLLNDKVNRWTAGKKECVERMVELAEVFSGTKPLTRVERNDHLQAWFLDMSRHLSGLEHNDYIAAGRKMAQIIAALEEVTQFHSLETNVQVSQFLAETRRHLHAMLRTINIKDEHVTTLDRLSELSYAWNLISDLTPLVQAEIKRQPHVVKRLRAVFLKLSAAIYRPLMRIEQAGSSADLAFVSKYYSGELVSYVRKVLQIIPASMFQIIEQIIVLQTQRLRELPTRLDKDKLREFAQLDERHSVARLTHDISTFADGMLAMKKTLLGIVNVDPKQLLEDGIRKELVRLLATAFDEALRFNSKARQSELVQKLRQLATRIDGFQRSFEYLADYVGIDGLRIYQQELSRIVGFNIELECNSFLRTKIQEWQSIYQSKAIPIPVFAPAPEDPSSVNFIGRLARELIRVTDPRYNVFISSTRTWYEYKTRQPVADPQLFATLRHSVGVFCLAGLDRFMSFMIVRQLQNIFGHLDRSIFRTGSAPASSRKNIEEAARSLSQFAAFWDDYASSPSITAVTPELASKSYSQAASRLNSEITPLIDGIVRVGQLQLIRCQLQFELFNASRFESKLLAGALDAINEAVLAEARRRPMPPESELVSELATYLESTGMTDPLEKIYVTCRPYPRLAHLLAVAIGAQLPRLGVTVNGGVLIAKKPASTSESTVDISPVTIGCATVLRQLHPSCSQVFSKLLCHFAAASTVQPSKTT